MLTSGRSSLSVLLVEKLGVPTFQFQQSGSGCLFPFRTQSSPKRDYFRISEEQVALRSQAQLVAHVWFECLGKFLGKVGNLRRVGTLLSSDS